MSACVNPGTYMRLLDRDYGSFDQSISASFDVELDVRVVVRKN